RTRRRPCAPCGACGRCPGRWWSRSRFLFLLVGLVLGLIERLTLELAERGSLDLTALLRRARTLERLCLDAGELGLQLRLEVPLPQDGQCPRDVVAEL